jgi:hypothetical protein
MHDPARLAVGHQPNILNSLRAGGVLKLSPKTQRFFLIQHSRELACDQHQALRLASDGTLRPNGVDSHGLCVFALATQRQQPASVRRAPA